MSIVPVATPQALATQDAEGYSTDATLKNITSITLYDNYGSSWTKDFFFRSIGRNPGGYLVYVQAYNMPAFYSPVVSAEVRDGGAYLTFRLPVANKDETPKTFEVLYTTNMDPDTYVRGVPGRPSVNEATITAALSQIAGYDAARNQAYLNAYKLAPFASYEDIVKSGNAMEAGSSLATKKIQELWPIHKDDGMKVSLMQGDEPNIARFEACFADGTSQTFDLDYLGTSSLAASYVEKSAGVLYQPDFWVLGDSGKKAVNRVASFINSKTWNSYFAPFKTDMKMHRTVRDYFDNGMHENAEEVAANLLSNIDSWSPTYSECIMWDTMMRNAESAMPTDDWQSTKVELKMFNLLFLYTYWNRFLDFDLGGGPETGFQANANAFLVMAFRGNVLRSGCSLEAMTPSVLTSAMLNFAETDKIATSPYTRRLAPYTGCGSYNSLVETLVHRVTNYSDPADWFAGYMSSISFFHEYKPPVVEGFPETDQLIWRGWDQAKRYPDSVPLWLTMKPGAMYFASTSMILTAGPTGEYSATPELNDAYRESYTKLLDGIFHPASEYAATVATIVGKDRVNSVDVLTCDANESMYDTGKSQTVYFESQGLWGKTYTEDPYHKNYTDVTGYYITSGQGAGAMTINQSLTVKRIHFLVYKTLGCGWSYVWSHELAHAIDNDVYLGGDRRGINNTEDYTDGLLTQNMGNGSLSPVMNLSYEFSPSTDLVSNFTHNRIRGKANLDDFYHKTYEAFDTLDYAALKAFLRLSKDEQNAVASQVWFDGQNGNSDMDTGATATFLYSRKKVLDGYDGTPATMPVNASVFNDGSKKFETIEEVYDNQIFLRPGVPENSSITWLWENYVTEDTQGIWWFPVHCNGNRPDSRSFKVEMYRVLGRHGYDAFTNFGRSGGGDLAKLKAISGCSSFKEWQLATYDAIEKKKDKLAPVNFDALVDKFEAAMKVDAEKHDRNLGATHGLRTRMFFMMKRTTNDFRYGVFDAQKPAVHIRTLDDLRAISDDPFGIYVLDNDIDASSVAGIGSTPLVSGVFYGRFDGGGHRIYSVGEPLPALFAGVRHGYVKDLSLEGALSDKVSPTIVNSEIENISYIRFERDIDSMDDFLGMNEDLRQGVNTFHLNTDLNFSEWSAANAAADPKQANVIVQPMAGSSDLPITFNGNGHRIIGLKGASLFSRVCFATITDLSISDCENLQDASNASRVGVLASSTYRCTISDIYLSNVKVSGKSQVGFVSGDDGFINSAGRDTRDGGSQFARIQVMNGALTAGTSSASGVCYGGFVTGRMCQSSLEDAYVQGALTTYGVSCGGIVGAITKSATLNRCVSNVSINCPKSTRNGGVIGDIEEAGFNADATKVSNCFGLADPSVYKPSSAPDVIQRTAGARLANYNVSSAANVFESCYENASIQNGSSLAASGIAGVSFARTDLTMPANRVFASCFDRPYNIPNLRDNKALFERLGFSDKIWEFDPTISVGYPVLRFEGDKSTFYDYDIEFSIDFEHEKLLFSGSDFSKSMTSIYNLPFFSIRAIPQLQIQVGDWVEASYLDSMPPSYMTAEDNSLDLGPIVSDGRFKNEETAAKGTRTVSLFYNSRFSKKPFSFEEAVELPPRPAMECADRVKGVRANSKGMGAIYFASAGVYDASELEYRSAEDTSSDWTPLAASTTPVAPGTYQVRIAATDSSFASFATTVTVEEFDPAADLFQLVLETNGGAWSEGFVAPEQYSSENGLALPDVSVLARPGYTFQGWYQTPDFTGAPIASISSGTTDPVVLYAKWDANTYALKLNLNGGTFANAGDNRTSYTVGTDLQLPTPTRAHRYFAGWFDNEQCEGMPVASLSKSDYGDKAFWAKWDPIVHSVTLHAQGGTLREGVADSFTYEEGLGAALPTASDLSLVGHDFKGWYDNKECTGAALASIPTTASSDIELWAKWTPQIFDVELNFNGGKTVVGESDVVSYQYGTETVLPQAERGGYEFAGWFDNAACAGDPVDGIADDETGNKKFWAKWNALTYSVTYDLGRDAEGVQPPAIDLSSFVSFTTGMGLTLPDADTMAWEDHVFAGWYDNPQFSGTPITAIGSDEYGDLALYARWAGNACVLTYYTNGGQFQDPPETIYSLAAGAHHEGEMIALPAGDKVSRTGYRFEGWFTDEGFNGQAVESVSLAKGVVSLYAKWQIEQYAISYELNGGSFTNGFVPPSVYTIESGGLTLPSAADLARPGHKFAGWYEDATFATPAVVGIGEGETGDRTFYAKWEETGGSVVKPPALVILSLAMSVDTAGDSAKPLPIAWDENGYCRIEMPRSQMPTKPEDFSIKVPDGVECVITKRTMARTQPLSLSPFSVSDKGFEGETLPMSAQESSIWDILLRQAGNASNQKLYTLEIVPVDDPEPGLDPSQPSVPQEPGTTDPGSSDSSNPQTPKNPSKTTVSASSSDQPLAKTGASASSRDTGGKTLSSTGDDALDRAISLACVGILAAVLACAIYRRRLRF